MNKTELINAVSEQTDVSKKDVKKVIDAFTDVVGDTIASGDSVQLVGFGTFTTSARSERQGINPKTKEPITIPASTVPKFKAGTALKEKVK